MLLIYGLGLLIVPTVGFCLFYAATYKYDLQWEDEQGNIFLDKNLSYDEDQEFWNSTDGL